MVPLGRGYFSDDSRHFVPGYYQTVPPGQKPFVPLSSTSRQVNAYERSPDAANPNPA